MLHSVISRSRRCGKSRLQSYHQDIAQAFGAPVTPAAYLRLRRGAERLTLEQAAERIATRGTDRAELVALMRLLEREGVVARDRATIQLLTLAYPLDVDVYFQLATEPADRHPSICRGCGCSEYDPCQRERGPCAWAGQNICTRCTDGETL